MATYEYRCGGCDHAFEIKQSMLDEPLVRCPQCNEDKLARVIQPTRAIFKGYGWTPKSHRRR